MTTESGHRRIADSEREFGAAEELTSGGLPLSSMPPLPEDRDEALGVLYAAVARQGRHLEGIKRDYGVIRTEVTHMRKDMQEDRGVLIDGSSRRAARHASNRMAGLMGGLFALYELAAPYLHELARWVHH